MKRHDLDKFELSQAYLFFYDKLEKANFFLEQVLDTVGEDLDSRLVQRLLESPVSDGGQWDMVFNLVDKYGLCPQVCSFLAGQTCGPCTNLSRFYIPIPIMPCLRVRSIAW